MNWLQRYRMLSYLKNSIWILPLVGMILGIITVRLIYLIDLNLNLTADFDPAAGSTMLSALAGAIFTLIIFVCSALLIVVQLAGAQLTPRYIALAFHRPVIKVSLSVFVFTFTFTLSALLRIQDQIPVFTGYVAVYLCMVSIIFFFYLVDKVGRILRPSGALSLIGMKGRDVILRVYPRLLTDPIDHEPSVFSTTEDPAPHYILNRKEGVLLAFDSKGLIDMAAEHDCLIELVPQVGDFIAAGQPLFKIYCKGTMPGPGKFFSSVAVGPERTMQQDPAFAFRIIVDIASKGLSPAINDPTTAVLAIDQIQYLLRHLSQRRLDDRSGYDESGVLRLIYRTPDWEDFIHLAVTEIRQFGGASIQIARRLRAMLQGFISLLPDERTHILKVELMLLENSSKRFFPDLEDRALADVSDLQGVGGR